MVIVITLCEKYPPGTVVSYATGFLSLARFTAVLANILLLVDGKQLAAGVMVNLTYESGTSVFNNKSICLLNELEVRCGSKEPTKALNTVKVLFYYMS